MFRGRADLQAGLPIQKTGARSHLSQVEKSWSTVFFGSSVSFVKSGIVVNYTLHGNASDVANCFPAHTSHHLMTPNITKYLMTQNITGIIYASREALQLDL